MIIESNHPGPGSIRDVHNDYKNSNSLTKHGLELLGQSIEAYLYCILNAQARSKQSIVTGLILLKYKLFSDRFWTILLLIMIVVHGSTI